MINEYLDALEFKESEIQNVQLNYKTRWDTTMKVEA